MSIGSGSDRLLYTHMCEKNMMPGKSNVCKAFQEAILCIKGTLSIVLSSAHSLPISTPCQTSPPSLHSNTHTHTIHKGYLGQFGSNQAG